MGSAGSSPRAAKLTVAGVMAAYNAAATIGSALASVEQQTLRPDEFVVVDDGSTDGTGDKARGSVAVNAVVSIANSGQSAANNVGARETSSSYIAYLDADDNWVSRKVEIFRSVAEGLSSPGMVVSDFRRRDFESGEWYSKTSADIFGWIRSWPGRDTWIDAYRVRVFDRDAAVEALLKGFPVFASALMVRRDLLDRVGGWNVDLPRCKDFDLALRLAASEGMVFIDEPLSIVHRHGGHGADYAYIARQLEWDLRVMDGHVGSGDVARRYGRLVRRYRARRTVFRGDFAASRGQLRDALRWYLRGLAYPRQYLRVGQRFAGTLGLLAREAGRRIRGARGRP